MNERWKPKYGEEYWVVICGAVIVSTWRSDYVDNYRWGLGNCFKTKEEAEAAAEKVKALLLSLHDNGETLQANIQDKQPVTDCNQFPKLTAEVFDRPDCPKWAKYAAVDKSGIAFFYEYKPVCTGTCYQSTGKTEVIDSSIQWDATDYQNILIERPAKLPDWCKVGEWVAYYEDKGYKYFKIAKIELNRLYSEDGKFCLMCDVGGARLRSYNAEEMKALVGKVIEDKDGDCYLIYKYDATENTVETSSFIVDAEALLRDCSVDGKNAGVLEHLNENGEWVE